MNPFFKVYCRIYQAAFHAALPVLPYREPEIFHSIAGLEPLLRRLAPKSVLLVTDNFLYDAGMTAPIEALLAKNRISCAVYHSTRPNPTVDNVEEARAMYLAHGCGAIIALGGGSSIDCGKALGARIAYPKSP